MSTKPKTKFDIRQHITNQIIQAIETAGDFQMPWHRQSGGMPRNVASGKTYSGVNTLNLWIASQQKGFSSSEWGTFKQWKEKGASVIKGQKGTPVVFYKKLMTEEEELEAELSGEKKPRFALRYSTVFNADQVDGYEPEVAAEIEPVDRVERIERVEAFVEASGARVLHMGQQAFYSRSADEIVLPPPERFVGTDTSSPTDAYYSTLLHELTHWTGHESRCHREFGQRFGDRAYAFEELVAELGSAYLCADLGVAVEPRPDHAAYLKHWLEILKNDKSAIFTAAGQAQKAADFLHDLEAKYVPAPEVEYRPEDDPRLADVYEELRQREQKEEATGLTM